jgi:Rieske Fe-S protein
MDRKEFLKTCGYACLGIIGVASLLESCVPSKQIEVNSATDVLPVSKNEFYQLKKENVKTLRHILVKTKRLDYPIVVYRNSDTNFSAVLLKCTHQGNELNVNGDILTCPAHGSEFNNNGEVVSGPAELNLKSFLVKYDENNIYIHLT